MIPGPVLAYAREANDGPSLSIHGCHSLARYGFSSSKLGRSLWMSVSIACSFAAWCVAMPVSRSIHCTARSEESLAVDGQRVVDHDPPAELGGEVLDHGEGVAQ